MSQETLPETKSTKKRRELHPLAAKQFERVICRPVAIRRRMEGVWAAVFKPGDRTNTFLGKRFLPLGSSIMMVQCSEVVQRKGREREAVPVFGIKAQIDPDTGVVSWDRFVLDHDIGLRAFPGAEGKIMDPRDDHHRDPRQRGKGSWLEQALTVDAARRGASGRNFKLPVVPVLPRVFYAVNDVSQLPFEDTPALRNRVDRHMAAGNSHYTPVAKLDDIARDMLLKAEWPSIFIPPGEEGNTTSFHLVDHIYSTRVRSTTRIYECFDERLIGVDVWNPMSNEATAAKIRDARLANPARQVFANCGLDPAEDSDAITDEQFQALLAGMREVLPDPLFTEHVLCDALSMLDEPISDLPAQHRLFKAALKSSIAECCTTQNIQHAIDHGQGPLFADGLCKIQVLHTDPRRSRAEALWFDSSQLGRERVTATLYKA